MILCFYYVFLWLWGVIKLSKQEFDENSLQNDIQQIKDKYYSLIDSVLTSGIDNIKTDN